MENETPRTRKTLAAVNLKEKVMRMDWWGEDMIQTYNMGGHLRLFRTPSDRKEKVIAVTM